MNAGRDWMANKEFMLNSEGKYLVRIADEDDTIGIFKGYAALGGDTAIVIEMDGGKIRFVPVAQIVYIDVLEPGVPEVKDTPKGRDVYYG